MDNCRKFFKGEGFIALSSAQKKFFETQYDEFSNTKDFVISVRDRYKTLQELGGMSVPFDAVALIYNQLKKVPEWESFINVEEETYQKL